MDDDRPFAQRSVVAAATGHATGASVYPKQTAAETLSSPTGLRLPKRSLSTLNVTEASHRTRDRPSVAWQPPQVLALPAHPAGFNIVEAKDTAHACLHELVASGARVVSCTTARPHARPHELVARSASAASFTVAGPRSRPHELGSWAASLAS